MIPALAKQAELPILTMYADAKRNTISMRFPTILAIDKMVALFPDCPHWSMYIFYKLSRINSGKLKNRGSSTMTVTTITFVRLNANRIMAAPDKRMAANIAIR